MNCKVIYVILAFATGVILLRRLHLAPAILEVERTQLELVDGLFRRPGHSNVFTGWIVEHYESGAIKSRSLAANGLLHGVSDGWHTNGQLQVREHFREGISCGLRTKWHENGQKLSEVMIVDGKLEGTFRRWHAGGAPAEQIELVAGEPHGLSVAFYESGFLKAEARLEHGRLKYRQSWADGDRKPTPPLAAH